MTGFTANLSNLPSGTTAADIDRQFGERTHFGDCPAHPDSDWSPGEELIVAARALVLNARVSDIEGYRVQRDDFEELRAICEPPCQCDSLAQAYAEDAAEHAREEDEGR